MGYLHAYYAIESVRRGLSRIVVVFVDGVPAGIGVYYVVNGRFVRVCVHYYIVVRREYRGIGIGKILVSSIEELNKGVDGFIATTVYGNRASRRLFRLLGYHEYTWDTLNKRLGYDVVKEIIRATCGFEDDLIMVKTRLKDPLKLLSILSREKEAVDSLWEKICLEPWIELNRL